MQESFSHCDKKFHQSYFNSFTSYLNNVFVEKKPLKPLEDDVLYGKFFHALLNKNPKFIYKHEPWRYFFYYNNLLR